MSPSPKKIFRLILINVLPQQRLGMMKAEVDTSSSACFLRELKGGLWWFSKTERQIQKEINWLRVFCEQLTLCPTQLFPGGVLKRYIYRFLIRKPYNFSGKALLELLVNHFCFSRGDASVHLPRFLSEQHHHGWWVQKDQGFLGEMFCLEVMYYGWSW